MQIDVSYSQVAKQELILEVNMKSPVLLDFVSQECMFDYPRQYLHQKFDSYHFL